MPNKSFTFVIARRISVFVIPRSFSPEESAFPLVIKESFSILLALWWVPVGHLPGIDEAKKRLAHLDAHGPTQFAFTFKKTFEPDEEFQAGIDWSSFVPCPAV